MTADGRGNARPSTEPADQKMQMQSHLRVLGLPPGATWDEITAAHRRLVSDLTPGPGASHGKLPLAEKYLEEVNAAYASLQRLVAVA